MILKIGKDAHTVTSFQLVVYNTGVMNELLDGEPKEYADDVGVVVCGIEEARAIRAAFSDCLYEMQQEGLGR